MYNYETYQKYLGIQNTVDFLENRQRISSLYFITKRGHYQLANPSVAAAAKSFYQWVEYLIPYLILPA